MWNFYPRPPRGGRPVSNGQSRRSTEISIHALREEGDTHVYPFWMSTEKFLSTPSARRATGSFRSVTRIRFDFYPRPPRGGRLTVVASLVAWWEFLSTPSARRATRRSRRRSRSRRHFYPRPPRGGRLCLAQDGHSGHRFLSTPSARRATDLSARPHQLLPISIHALREEGDSRPRWGSLPDKRISIHALREEGDSITAATTRRPQNFYPRPPRGGRLPTGRNLTAAVYFYPRPPRGGRRPLTCAFDISSQFLSTPSARRATIPLSSVARALFYFYPRPPRGGRLFSAKTV